MPKFKQVTTGLGGGRSVVEETPTTCVVCQSVTKKSCSDCHTPYCSKQCQLSHRKYHRPYCNAISEFMKNQKEKVYGCLSVREKHVGCTDELKLMKLIGNKPTINCYLNGKQFNFLWDTGSMISMVDREWASENFPDKTIIPVEEFLGDKVLNVVAANSTKIALDGVLVLKFSLGKESNGFMVPVLVSSTSLSGPILGYNVIEHLVLEKSSTILSELSNAVGGVPVTNVEALVSMIELNANHSDFLSEVKCPVNVNLLPGTRTQIKCRLRCPLNTDVQNICFQPTPLLIGNVDLLESVVQLRRGRTNYVFVDVLNSSNQPQRLGKGTVLGSVHCVEAVVPMPKVLSDQVQVPVGKSASVSQMSAVDGEEVDKFDLKHLSMEQQDMLRKVLQEESNVFSVSDADIGDIKDFQMDIHLTDSVPVKEAYRRIPRHLYNEVRNYVDDLLTNGWIRESFSSYSSPIVCARKKDGSLRMCIDYRKLNNKSVPDCQPIPRIQDLVDGLQGQAWFSTLDMSKAYHQGYVAEESRQFTAFSTPWMLYEWIRLPFGLKNCPPAFQRFMSQTLGDYKGSICDAYLDDVLCYAKTFEEHVVNLKKVLQRLREKGIKLRPDKCEFAKREVRYLGRLISVDGYRADPQETAALEKFRSPPKTLGELRSLLGFLGYYRSYVENFAQKLKPLYDLLKTGYVKQDVNPTKSKKKVGQNYDAKAAVVWNDVNQKCLDNVIDILQSNKVIAYPDFDIPFFVTCDASALGLGAVLYQKQNGVNKVISYASRSLSEAERNYNLHSGKLEFLALKWAVTERFADYLRYGPPFTVYTDNNPLTYVLTTAKLNAVGLRWVAELADYQFTIKYRPGKVNVDADYLSRNVDVDMLQKECSEEFDPQSLQAVINHVNVQCDPVSLSVNSSPVSSVMCNKVMLNMEPERCLDVISMKQLSESQQVDEVIGPVYKYVLEKCRPSRAMLKSFSRDSKILLKSFGKLSIENGVMYRCTAKFRQVVLPKSFHEIVYTELHEKMAHLGSERVIDLAVQRFYWPRMGKDIEGYIRNRCRCVVSKKPNVSERAGLIPIRATYPFQMVSIDFIHLDKCKGGFEYALVVIDHFTRFAQVYATRSKKSKAAADKLFNEFILQFGFPERIHHDRGGEFNSELFAELHRLTGIKASNTTTFHPQGDGQVERWNRSLCNMLKALSEQEKKDWKKHLPKLAFAYNSTVNKTTGFSPFFLLFGRQATLPIDTMFESDVVTNMKVRSYQEYVEEWKKSMSEAYAIANEKIGKSAEYNKSYYDKKAKCVEIVTGDNVLVRNLREKGGTGKLRNHWENRIFKVVDKRDDSPVYTCVDVHNPKDKRVLHRNLLLKCNDLPLDVVEDSLSPSKKKTGKVVKKKVTFDIEKSQADIENEEEEEEEFEIQLYKEVVDDPDVVPARNEDCSNSVNDDVIEVPRDESVEIVCESKDVVEIVGEETNDSEVEVSDVEEHENNYSVSSQDETFLGFEDESDEEFETQRRGNRQRTQRRMFTYDDLGGNPVRR